MKKSYDNLPYEFLLKINGKPIVGRNFHIKGYNADSLKSIELKETIDDATRVIEEQFKLKSNFYLWRYYNPYATQTTEEVEELKKDCPGIHPYFLEHMAKAYQANPEKFDNIIENNIKVDPTIERLPVGEYKNVTVYKTVDELKRADKLKV